MHRSHYIGQLKKPFLSRILERRIWPIFKPLSLFLRLRLVAKHTYSLDFLEQSDSMGVVWRIAVQLLSKTVPKRPVNNLRHSALQTTEGKIITKHHKKLSSYLTLSCISYDKFHQILFLGALIDKEQLNLKKVYMF